MSVNTLEAILYDISVSRGKRERFKDDPDGFLQRYPLSEDEFSMLKELRVRDMGELGVNPMLTMGVWMMMNGPQSLPQYLKTMAGKAEEAT